MSIEAMKQAVDWAEAHGEIVFAYGGMDAVNKMNCWYAAIRNALAHPEQAQPHIGWLVRNTAGKLDLLTDLQIDSSLEKYERLHKLYTSPPQRQPLTDEQIQKCYETTGHYQTLRPQDRFAVFALARAIEAAHGIKGEA